MLSTTKEKWSAIFAEQQQSQLTVAQYCRQQQISPSSFYQRKRELETQASSSFVKATVTKSVEMQVVNARIILNVGEVNLSLPSQTSAHYLAELVRGLQP